MVKMVVAYDGTDFSGFAAQRVSPRCAPSAACSAQAIGKVLRHDVRAHLRGPHRRGRARVGPGRELRVGARARRVAAPVGGQLDARSRGGRAVVRDRRARLRRPARRAVAALPLHDPQPAGARPVPRSLRVVGPRTARPARAAARGRSVRRRARLRVVLPQGPGRIVDSRGACSIRAGTTRATACCATRSARRRSAGRWCARSSARSWRSARASAGPGEMLAVLRAADRDTRGAARPAAWPVPLGGRLLVVTRPGACCPSSSARSRAA